MYRATLARRGLARSVGTPAHAAEGQAGTAPTLARRCTLENGADRRHTGTRFSTYRVSRGRDGEPVEDNGSGKKTDPDQRSGSVSEGRHLTRLPGLPGPRPT